MTDNPEPCPGPRGEVMVHPQHVTILDRSGRQIDAGTIAAQTPTGVVIESDRGDAHVRHLVASYDFEPGRTFRYDH